MLYAAMFFDSGYGSLTKTKRVLYKL
jgi:hypothetical protein